MIRVTFYNNKHFYYIYLHYAPNQIVLTNRFGQTEYYDYGSILKIEKQVKDLTVDEVIKLGLKPDGFTTSGFKKSDDKYTYHYELDDYIDITDIVKGSVKEE